jgi:myo-inositol-1(or 4)-monophosphatase
MDVDELLKTAEKAARAAGELMREGFGQPHQITVKGFRDLVTDTDLKVQETVTKIIRDNFPDHGFLTEEEDGSLLEDGPIIWIIDPVDGTTNFSRNLPAFCVSVAAVENKPSFHENNVLVGMIYDPMRDEMFSTARGGKNLLNNQVMHTSQIDKIADAQIAHDWNRAAHLRQSTLESVSRLTHEADAIRSFGSAALALAWVAAGRLDGYFNYSLKAWDMAAASLMIQQAGGRMSSLTGQTIDFSTKRSMSCLASNNHLHELLLAYMSVPGEY